MFQRILVPLDGTPLDEKVLGRASAMARACGAEIVLARAVPLPWHVGCGLDLGPAATLRSLREADQAAAEYLDGLARKLRREGHRVQCRTSFEPPARAVCQLAHVEGADVVVMASHRRTGLGRMLHGSVTAEVAREARCPVLVLQEEPPPPRPVRRPLAHA